DDMTEAPRDIAFAAHAITDPTKQLIVEDALQDPRFRDSPLAQTEPAMRFYVGTPLVDNQGFVLGTLCVIDKKPRKLNESQLSTLRILATQTVHNIQLRDRMRRIAELNRELEAKNEELDQFASIISHDLKEPLRTVRSFVDLLIEEKANQIDPSGREYLSFIDRTTSHMHDMVEDMLRYVRIGYDRKKMTVALSDLLADIQEDFGLLLTECNAEIHAESLPEVPGFPAELRQLLQNLLSNALKFTRPGVPPRVTVAAQELANGWKITFQDNGIGVPEAGQKRIFRLFERLHHADAYGGQGIGLAFCSKIVHLHGGEIGTTNNIGSGSTFWFTLPKAKAPLG
ncbi:MAG: ATP-binding protein, partial [Lewinella sp.]